MMLAIRQVEMGPAPPGNSPSPDEGGGEMASFLGDLFELFFRGGYPMIGTNIILPLLRFDQYNIATSFFVSLVEPTPTHFSK